MISKVDCNKCGTEFVVNEFCLGSIKKGDLVVWYFSCPACGERYHVFTSDSAMRKLVEKRKALQMKFKAAFAKKFKLKVIKQYEKELDRIRKKQLAMEPALRHRGEEILRGLTEP